MSCPFIAKSCKSCTIIFCGERERESCYSTPAIVSFVPQTFEEKVEMYMKCEKKTLAEMLAMRDMIMAHKNPPQEPVLTKTE